MQRYLYPQRKRLEILSAIFAGGYGVHIWAAGFHAEPLLWAGLHNGQALAFGQAMSLAAFIHALGVRINGQWRWSPTLRLAGMSAHTLMFAFLAIKGFWATGFYTYSWVTALLFMGALSALRDTKRALRWEIHGIRVD
jgi:hypothetical protein